MDQAAQMPAAQRYEQVGQSEELRRLKAKLKRVTEERDSKKDGISNVWHSFGTYRTAAMWHAARSQ